MPPEGPPSAERATEEHESSEWPTYSRGSLELQRRLGTRTPLPENLSDTDLSQLLRQSEEQVLRSNFHELTRFNEVLWRYKATQYAADLEDPQRGKKFDREEFIAANQLVTYNEALSEVTQYLADVLYNHELLQDLITSLPLESQRALEVKRNQASRYMAALRQAIDERVAFANAWKIQDTLGKQLPEDRKQELLRAQAEQTKMLSQRSREMLDAKDVVGIEGQANTLEARIIRIAAGQEKIESIEDGFLPQHLYLEILKHRYTQLIEAQKTFVKGGGLQREGGPLAKELLDKERKAVMEEMVSFAHELTGYQLHMSHLTTVQNMFGRHVSVRDALPSAEGRTNEGKKKEIAKSANAMKEFHLGRVEAVMKRANDEFSVGAFEVIRDNLMKGVLTSTGLTTKLAKFLSLAFPGVADLDKKVEDFLAGPIADSIGWPRDPETGMLKEKLSDEERNKILAKLGSLTKAIEKFQKENNSQNLMNTVSALRAVDAATAVSQEKIGQPKQPLPKERISDAKDAQTKIEQYTKQFGNREDAVATVHAMLLQQLADDWGDMNRGTGFIGAYASLLRETERIVGIQLDVAGACFQMSKNFTDLAKYLVVSAGVIAVVPWVVASAPTGYLLVKYGVVKPGMAAYRAFRGTPVAQRVGPRATPFQRAAWVGAIGYLTYDLYQNYQEIQSEHERLNDVKGNLAAELIKAGFKQDSKDPDKYKHPCGVVVSLKEIHENLDAQRAAQYARTGVVATELGVALLMGPRLLIGRAGLVLAAIAITIESGIKAWENKAARDFVASENTPPWLLVALGTSKTVKMSEYDLIVNSSSWNFIFTSTEAEKETVRQKMYFTIFNHELGAFAPELLREITAGRNNVKQIEQLYAEDFQNIVLPYIYVRLFERARAKDNGISWAKVKEGKIDRGYCVIPSDLTYVEIRAAMREAAILYVQHLREQRYITLLKRKEELEEAVRKNPTRREFQQQLVDTRYALDLLGRDEVFRKPITATLTPEDIKANGGRTRTELAIEMLYRQIDGGVVDFRLSNPKIKGLPRKELDFSSSRAVYELAVDDPALRAEAQNVVPLTTDEPEGALTPDWYRRYLAPILNPAGEDDIVPFGRPIDALPRNMMRMALAKVQTALPEKERSPFPKNIALAKAREMITQEAIQFFGKRRTATGFTQVEGFKGEERRFHSGPSKSTYSGLKGYGKEFHTDKLIAVVQESDVLDAGEEVVLLTFVFGDPKVPEKMYILQKAYAYVDFVDADADFYGLSRSTLRKQYEEKNRSTFTMFYGLACFSGAREFEQTQPGGRVLMDFLRKELTREDVEHARQRAEAEQEAEQRRGWEEETRRFANLTEDLRAKEVRRAVERALVSTDSFVLVPPKNPKAQPQYLRYFTDRNAYLDMFLSVDPPPPPPTGPAFSAGPSRKPQDGINDPLPEHAFTFRIWSKGVATPREVSVPNMSFFAKGPLSAEKTGMAYAALTTPFPTDAPDWCHEQSLSNLLKICRYVRDERKRRYYNAELFKGLRDMYLRSSNKQRFLQELFRELQNHDSLISPTSIPAILKSIRGLEEKEMFKQQPGFVLDRQSSITLKNGYTLSVAPVGRREEQSKSGKFVLEVLGPQPGSLVIEGVRHFGGDVRKEVQIEDLKDGASVTVKDSTGKVLLDRMPIRINGQSINDPVQIDPARPPTSLSLKGTVYMRLPKGYQWIAVNTAGKASKVLGLNEYDICSCGRGYPLLKFWAPRKDVDKDPPSFEVKIENMS